jgi:hypothetical protein
MMSFGARYAGPAQVKIDATPIAPHLYQGSVPPSGRALADARFTMLVLAACEHQPRSTNFPGLRSVVHAPIDDAIPSPDEIATVVNAAKLVAEEIKRGGKVLVTCMQGRNRSGLISALAIRSLYGFSGKQVLLQVQTMRQNALTNPSFQQLLADLPSRSPR